MKTSKLVGWVKEQIKIVCAKPSKNDEGYSLLEVLIALLIVSLSLINIYKMQTNALIRNYDAYWYTKATSQIASLLERLQVGPISREIAIWKQNVASSLPQGQGEYDFKTKAISVCWLDRFNHDTKCLKK